jgi:hypothetical protein
MARSREQDKKLKEIQAMYEKHALALGLACMSWSLLESVIDDFLADIIPLENDPRQDVAGVFHANIDFREKIKILVSVAFIRKYNDQWFRELQEWIDEIDNDLRTERNRYVHDSWTLEPDNEYMSLSRTQKVSKLIKPQAYQLELITQIQTPVSLEDLEGLGKRISDAIRAMVDLRFEWRADCEKCGGSFASPDKSRRQNPRQFPPRNSRKDVGATTGPQRPPSRK